ncbi:hypothetical protein ACODT3_10530 [Streptomyces sp. 4.24]|uniref:hypothetical protein n=1 Tax=Streptomyces tritrimontium TaxID=3406573 RepID=UPI003BB611B2
MTADPLNQQVVLMAMPPQEEAVRLAEQGDATAYVARRARDDADRDLLMDILGLATPARTVALAAGSLLLLALGHRINRGGTR